jgi:hypothetical protein
MVTMNLDAFAVLPGASSAVVTPLGGSPVTTIVQWEQEDAPPAGQEVGAGVASAVNRRVVAWVRRDQVPNLPMGSTIVGGPAQNVKTYRVHAVDTGDPDYFIAVMV